MAYRIEDALTNEYADFLQYCEKSGKVFIDDLTNLDFVAYRSLTGVTRETISTIKSLLDSYDGVVVAEDSMDTTADIDIQTLDNNTSLSSDTPYAGEDEVEEEGSHTIIEVEDDDMDSGAAETTDDNSDSANKRSNIPARVILDDRMTLGEYFKVDPQDFETVSIDVLNLSVRPFKRMRAVGANTVGALLKLKIGYIQGIKNLGLRSVNEIIQNTKKFLEDSGAPFVQSSVQSKKVSITQATKTALEKLLAGEMFDPSYLSESEVLLLERFKEAIDVLGVEICTAAYSEPDIAQLVCGAFAEFSKPILYLMDRNNEIDALLRALPCELINKKIIPFMEAFEASTGERLNFLKEKASENSVVSDLLGWLKYNLNIESSRNALYEAKSFLTWLDCDLKALSEKIILQMESILSKNIRCLDVYVQRLQGKTLDEIGSSMGVTKERVRQMETRATRAFFTAYKAQKHDLIMFMYGLTNGDTTIFIDDLKRFVGEKNAEIIWDCLKKEEHSCFEYSKEYQVIVIKTKGQEMLEIRAKIRQAIGELPALMHEADADSLVETKASEYGLPLDLFAQSFNEAYKKDGAFYHSEYLSVIFMCEYVLKERFRSGYKTSDEYEGKKFQKYLEELFGKPGKSITLRAVDAKVSDIGCLCDRGKYIHPDYLNVDESLVQSIYDYLENSKRKVIAFGEIFEALKDVFAGSEITNRYYLHGVLKKYGCKYKTGRDFVIKDSSATYVSELEAFVEERGITHKSEILAEFTSLTEISLSQVIARCTHVYNIEDGNYIHSSLFDIKPSDYPKLREYLKTKCAELPVNIRLVYDDLFAIFPEFIVRNELTDRHKLYAALTFMFNGEFNFSRPYIAKLGENDVTNRNVILRLVADYDTIEIDELIDICVEHGINYVSSSALCQKIAPDFFRVDAIRLVRRELVGLTDEIMDWAENNLRELLEAKGYVPAPSVDDFLCYPQLSVEWSSFLLESIILYKKNITVINTIVDPMKRPNSIYVTDEYSEDSFHSFLLRILTPLVKDCYFANKIEMREWLYDNGFVENGLPNFLESAKYFYVSDRGVCVTQEG